MKLSELFAETKVLVVAVGGGELNVTYRPDAITPETLDRMSNAASAPGEAIVSTVVELVASWDLTDDDGSIYPLTVKDVRRLPLSFLSTVIKAITDDINPNASRRKPLNATL